MVVIEVALIWTGFTAYARKQNHCNDCSSRCGRRRAFKFAPSCFELTDIDGSEYHTVDNLVIWSLIDVLAAWVTTDEQDRHVTDHIRSAGRTRVSFLQLDSPRRERSARIAVRSYTRHHVIRAASTSLFHTVLITATAARTFSGEVPDAVDRVSKPTRQAPDRIPHRREGPPGARDVKN